MKPTKGYILQLMRKESNKSSVYINQLCSDLYLSYHEAELELVKRSNELGYTVCLQEEAWNNLPNNFLFFHIVEINIK